MIKILVIIDRKAVIPRLLFFVVLYEILWYTEITK
jgi:hypothetical protein